MLREYHIPKFEIGVNEPSDILNQVRFHSKDQIMEIVDDQIKKWSLEPGSSKLKLGMYRLELSMLATDHQRLHDSVTQSRSSLKVLKSRPVNPGLDKDSAFMSQEAKDREVTRVNNALSDKRRELESNNGRLGNKLKSFAGSADEH